MARKPQSPDQIKRATARLHAIKGAAMRAMKDMPAKTKGRQKRMPKRPGIHMGKA